MKALGRFFVFIVLSLSAPAFAVFLLFLGPSRGGEDIARLERVRSDFALFSEACATFFETEGRWPQDWSELETRGLLDRELKDPWTDDPYRWYLFDNEPPFLVSWGADEAPGGDGTDTDLVGRDLYDRERAAARAAARPPKPGR